MFKLIVSLNQYEKFKQELKKKDNCKIEEIIGLERFPAIFHIDLKDTITIEQLSPEIISNYIQSMDDLWK